MMKSPESKVLAGALVAAALLFAGKVAVDANKSPDNVVTSAKAVASRVSHELKPGKDVEVAAAIIAVDGGVNFRSSPVLLNTNNAQMVTGNNIYANPDTPNAYLSSPTILVRPMVVKNENRLSDHDPEYWLAGLQDDRLVWVGLNDETKQHMQAYQLPESGGEMPDFTDSVTVDYVSPGSGIVFQSSGYMASAGLIRESIGNQDPYLLRMQEAGYQEVPLPLG
jgi:hypothetical protein